MGDLNGDGRPDLVLGGDSLWVLLNDGNRLSWPARYRLPTAAAGLAVGEVNRDGFDDVAVVTSDSTQVLSHNSAGIPIRAGVLPFGSPDNITSVLVDLDGDGGVDFALPSCSAGCRAFWNTGTGLPAVPQTVNTAFVGVTQMIAADLDGDGLPDLVGISDRSRQGRIAIEWNMGGRVWEHVSLYVEDQMAAAGKERLRARQHLRADHRRGRQRWRHCCVAGHSQWRLRHLRPAHSGQRPTGG